MSQWRVTDYRLPTTDYRLPLLRVYTGEIVFHKVFVALRDVVVVEGVTRLVFVLAVDLLVRDLGRADVVGVGGGGGAALLAAWAVLPLQGYSCRRSIHAAGRRRHG